MNRRGWTATLALLLSLTARPTRADVAAQDLDADGLTAALELLAVDQASLPSTLRPELWPLGALETIEREVRSARHVTGGGIKYQALGLARGLRSVADAPYDRQGALVVHFPILPDFPPMAAVAGRIAATQAQALEDVWLRPQARRWRWRACALGDTASCGYDPAPGLRPLELPATVSACRAPLLRRWVVLALPGATVVRGAGPRIEGPLASRLDTLTARLAAHIATDSLARSQYRRADYTAALVVIDARVGREEAVATIEAVLSQVSHVWVEGLLDGETQTVDARALLAVWAGR